MGSVEISFTRQRKPLPRSGSLGYQCPLHLFIRRLRTPVSKAISETAKSCCRILEDHQDAAWVTSSEQSSAPSLEGVRVVLDVPDLVGVNSGACAVSRTPYSSPSAGWDLSCMVTDAIGVIDTDVVEDPDPFEEWGGIACSSASPSFNLV
eukprot:05277_5